MSRDSQTDHGRPGGLGIFIMHTSKSNYSFLSTDRKVRGYSDGPGVRPSVNIFVSAL